MVMAGVFGMTTKKAVKPKAPKPAAVTPPAATPAPLPSPFGQLNFGGYSANAAYKRDATLAQNAYSRFLSQQRGTRDLGKIDTSMTSGLERLAAGYGKRGLGSSGIFNRGQSEYAQDWTNQRQTVLSRIYDEMRQAAFGDAGAWAEFDNNVADTAQSKYQKILETAAQLDQLRPFFGG